jgi:SPP1 family predicted phage head-tail adaptor
MPANLGRVNLGQITGAGDLRHRVTFAERDQTEDEFGNVSQAWVDRFTISANIVPRLGGEAVTAARLAGQQPVIIRVRTSPATVQITTDWRATDERGKVYNIRTAVDPLDGDNQHGMFIDMFAETGVAV